MDGDGSWEVMGMVIGEYEWGRGPGCMGDD